MPHRIVYQLSFLLLSCLSGVQPLAAGQLKVNLQMPLDVIPTPLMESSTRVTTALQQAVCYSPMHSDAYPLHGGPFDADAFAAAMEADFALLSKSHKIVRTFYSSFYGVAVAPIAAKFNIQLLLGVYMTQEAWYVNQVDDAIDAVIKYPDTIRAVLIGNECVDPVGPYSTSNVASEVRSFREKLRTRGSYAKVMVGTVQRATDWLDSSRRNEMLALANDCEYIGVNVYPFFDENFDITRPLAILDAVWNKLISIFPVEKVFVTETGWPTSGAPSEISPNNIPSLPNAVSYYNAFVRWCPVNGEGKEAVWFMAFDRAANDNSMNVELEKYFGFYTAGLQSKQADYPYPLSSLNYAPKGNTGSFGTILGRKVCRPRKFVADNRAL